MSADKPNNNLPDANAILLTEAEEIEEVAEAEEQEVKEFEIAKIIFRDSRAVGEYTALSEKSSFKRIEKEFNLEQKKTLLGEQIKYIPKLLGLSVLWLLNVSAFLLLNGFHYNYFALSDGVLIALITSTTANVLGLFYIVAKWLYPSLSAKEKKKPQRIKAKISGSTTEK